MKRLITCILAFLLVISYVCAQEVKGFQQYRQQMLSRYADHRHDVLSRYADFLQQSWKRFNAFKGEKRDNDVIPKPTLPPTFPTDEPHDVSPLSLPQPDTPQPQPTPTPQPTLPSLPIMPKVPTVVPASQQHFGFYGDTLSCRTMMPLMLDTTDEEAIANAWRRYHNTREATLTAQSLRVVAAEHGLNDWLTIEMVRTYVESLLDAPAATAERIVLEHFLLVQMGYDVRMARTERQMLLLVPTQEVFYNQPYLVFGGQRFYLFKDRLSPLEEADAHYYAYTLPDDVDAGRVVSLRFNGERTLKLHSGHIVHTTLDDGRISLSVSFDRAVLEALRHYPPMDIPDYAHSIVLPEIHASLWEQLRSHLEGKSQREAVMTLMHFTQYAFSYATDGDQHGYEKAYFLEENFYYPKNDCEDRAIFLVTAVRKLLGLQTHLVQYPGHECTAIHFTDPTITGDGYQYEGLSFIICDPTYIGASIGQCMPNYQHTRPIIQL